MKPLVIYHAPCQDGFTAAWACWKAHPDWEFYPAKHGDPPPDVLGRDVYMLDFSYKRLVLLDMAKYAKQIWIYDHHKTAEEDLQKYKENWTDLPDNIYVWFDMEQSGAALAWGAFHPSEPFPQLLLRVEDRDLWRFRHPDTKAVSAYLFSQDYDFKVWDWLMGLSNDPEELKNMASYGRVIMKKQKKDIDELLQNKFQMYIGGYQVWACNLPYTFSSDAGAVLAKDGYFGATFYIDKEYAYFSLRSTEDGIDVSEIAKQYEGGGHKHAAGFKVGRTFGDVV